MTGEPTPGASNAGLKGDAGSDAHARSTATPTSALAVEGVRGSHLPAGRGVSMRERQRLLDARAPPTRSARAARAMRDARAARHGACGAEVVALELEHGKVRAPMATADDLVVLKPWPVRRSVARAAHGHRCRAGDRPGPASSRNSSTSPNYSDRARDRTRSGRPAHAHAHAPCRCKPEEEALS